MSLSESGSFPAGFFAAREKKESGIAAEGDGVPSSLRPFCTASVIRSTYLTMGLPHSPFSSYQGVAPTESLNRTGLEDLRHRRSISCYARTVHERRRASENPRSLFSQAQFLCIFRAFRSEAKTAAEKKTRAGHGRGTRCEPSRTSRIVSGNWHDVGMS